MPGRKKLSAKKCGLAFLKILLKLKPQERSCLVDYLNDESIDKIGHLVFNALFTDLKIKPRQVKILAKKLKGHKRDLEYISNRSNPLNVRRKKVKKQSGSGLGILLASVVPALISLLAK